MNLKTNRATSIPEDAAAAETGTASRPWLPLVLAGVDSLDFGTVQIVVHNSKVVQVERLERHRFDVPKNGSERILK